MNVRIPGRQTVHHVSQEDWGYLLCGLTLMTSIRDEMKTDDPVNCQKCLRLMGSSIPNLVRALRYLRKKYRMDLEDREMIDTMLQGSKFKEVDSNNFFRNPNLGEPGKAWWVSYGQGRG